MRLLSSFPQFLLRRQHSPNVSVLSSSSRPSSRLVFANNYTRTVVTTTTTKTGTNTANLSRNLVFSFRRHHSTCSSTLSASMSANTTNVSRQQPPWRVPEGKPVPKLKLYNSMTRTKVTRRYMDSIGIFSANWSRKQSKVALTHIIFFCRPSLFLWMATR